MAKKKVVRVSGLKSIKKPQKGVIYEVIIRTKSGKRRRVGFKYTGKKGFGKWKVVYNKPV